MKKIEKLEKQIHEEWSDAEKHITCALLNKDIEYATKVKMMIQQYKG